MVKRKVFSILFVIVFLCALVVPVYAEHPFDPYMPTPVYGSEIPASAVFISYYISTTGLRYVRYLYSTQPNNNVVYVDTTTSFSLEFESGSFRVFSFSDSWNNIGKYNSYYDIFKYVTMDWILENIGVNSFVYSNVDIVDVNGNVLFERNSRIEGGVLIPNDYGEDPEDPEDPDDDPDYDEWYERVFDSITEWFSGVLEVLKAPFTAIAEGLNGVWGAVKNIKDDLKNLFIPSVNIIPMIREKFVNKFPIIEQAGNLFASLFNIGSNEPIFKITYKGMTLKIVDFTAFSDYIPTIKNLTGAFLLLAFLTKEIKRLPKLIRGRD